MGDRPEGRGRRRRSGVARDSDTARFIRVAGRQIGTPYVFGSEGPNAFDCSGLVWWALRKSGINVGRASANGYYTSLPSVSRNNLRPGDLVFFNYGRLGSGQADHVGIWLGNGRILDTRSPESPVDVRAMDWDAFIGAGRVAGLDTSRQAEVNRAIRAFGGNQGPSGGAGGGAGGNGGRATPAWSRGGPQITSRELRGILRGFGINPDDFMPLIDRAIREQWTPSEFTAAVYDSPIFSRTFPGIFNKDGSLKMTPAEYVQVAYGEGGILDIGREFGIKVNRRLIGEMIGGNNSLAEVAFKFSIVKEAKDKEPFRRALDRTFRAMGQPPLEGQEFAEWLAGKPNARIANIYEAATLQAEPGLAINAKDALAASKEIGEHGEVVDVGQLVQNIRAVKDFIAPELRAAGITDADLAVLESGADPKGIRSILEQLERNRQALVGTRLVGASGGTPALAPSREGL